MSDPFPQAVEINCAAWTANNLRDEADQYDAEAEGAPEHEAVALRARANHMRSMAAQTLTEAGFGADEVIEAVRYVDLTPKQLAQRELDQEAGRVAAANMLRSQRNAMLQASDWTEFPSSPLTDEQREEWRAYRQALRDITAQKNPLEPVWPTPPA